MPTDEAARLDEEDAVPPARGAGHDLLAIGRAAARPTPGRRGRRLKTEPQTALRVKRPLPPIVVIRHAVETRLPETGPALSAGVGSWRATVSLTRRPRERWNKGRGLMETLKKFQPRHPYSHRRSLRRARTRFAAPGCTVHHSRGRPGHRCERVAGGPHQRFERDTDRPCGVADLYHRRDARRFLLLPALRAGPRPDRRVAARRVARLPQRPERRLFPGGHPRGRPTPPRGRHGQRGHDRDLLVRGPAVAALRACHSPAPRSTGTGLPAEHRHRRRRLCGTDDRREAAAAPRVQRQGRRLPRRRPARTPQHARRDPRARRGGRPRRHHQAPPRLARGARLLTPAGRPARRADPVGRPAGRPSLGRPPLLRDHGLERRNRRHRGHSRGRGARGPAVAHRTGDQACSRPGSGDSRARRSRTGFPDHRACDQARLPGPGLLSAAADGSRAADVRHHQVPHDARRTPRSCATTSSSSNEATGRSSRSATTRASRGSARGCGASHSTSCPSC